MKVLLAVLAMVLAGCGSTGSSLLLQGADSPLAKKQVVIDKQLLKHCPESLTAVMPDSPTKSEVLTVKKHDNAQYSECALNHNGLIDVVLKAFPQPEADEKDKTSEQK